jgi:hypothetical protein
MRLTLYQRSPVPVLTFALVITLALLLIPTPFSFANTPVLAQADTGTQLVCDDVRYLMARDATPYDLNPTGTTVSDNTPIVLYNQCHST